MPFLFAFMLIVVGCAGPKSVEAGSYDIAAQGYEACSWEDQGHYFGLIDGVKDPAEIELIRSEFQHDFECDLDLNPPE